MTNGYHLFTLPFIDRIYTINTIEDQANRIKRNDFNCVRHLHLIIPDETMPCSLDISSTCIYHNLQALTVITSSVNSTLMTFIDCLIIKTRLRTLELRLTSINNHCHDFFR